MFLGIDLGTSAVKVIAWDGEDIRAQASVGLTVSSPHPGWSEQDPGSWITATAQAVADVAQQIDPAGIKGIGLSGQMHGATLLGADHQILRPCILWNDSRSAADCATLSERAPQIAQVAGVPPMPGFTAPKIMWLKRAQPETYAALRHILLPKDYVGLWLHGALATDRSDGSGTLWLDAQTGDWDPSLCAASDTDMDWLPKVYAGTDEVGQLRAEAAAQIGLPAGIPIYAGGGDAATGAVSVGAVAPGRGFISLGTSGQAFLCTDAHRPNPAQMVHAFAHTLPGGHYQMSCLLNGARPLAWMAEVLGCEAGDVVTAAQEANIARAPTCLPYLTGERSPHGDPTIRGAFIGLEDSTGRAEMAYAVMEAVAFSMADATDSFGGSLDAAPYLLAVGGGTRSDALLQMIADATGRRLGRADGAEAGPALGAALLAARGAGAVDDTRLATMPDVTTWFEPAARSETSLRRQERFRASYRALAPLFADG
ncbi:xylulokinase [Primorskyibacter sp. S187A]|uniref:xylulokinase n=1 Tax=Primorskyibacter sp. S187A TaxID=3415130 RepID=UPI003C7AEA3D